MTSAWQRVERVILSVFLPLAASLTACSDDDVTFAPVDAGSDTAADVSSDPRVDPRIDAV
jgi:hypothetical protein